MSASLRLPHPDLRSSIAPPLPAAATTALALLGAAVDEGVVGLGADRRIAFANAAAERILGRAAPDLVGLDVDAVLRLGGLGGAALALADALAAPLPPGSGSERRFTVHGGEGRPDGSWRVVRLPRDAVPELSALVVMRPADDGAPPAPGAVAPEEAETLAAVARELAGAGADVSVALERLAAGARTLLGASGACVVLLEGETGTVAAASGSVLGLRGHATELMAPPSLFHEAVTQRRLVVTNDAERDPRVDPRYGRAFGMRHVLVAPLLIDDAVVAVLCAVDSARGGFGAGDGTLAQRLADHGALALRNARLVRALERSARRAQLLADASRVLSRHVTPNAFFTALGRLVGETLGVCGYRVLLADRASRRVELLADGGTARGLPAVDDALFWHSSGGRTIVEGAPRFHGAAAGATNGDGAFAAPAVAGGARAFALLPLAIEGEVRGLLALHFPDERAFDDEERALLVDFAAQVALAVRNVSLLDARQRARTRAEAAAAVARAALDARDVAAGAAAILGALHEVVRCEGLALSVVDRERGLLRCVGATGAVAHLRGHESPLHDALRPDVHQCATNVAFLTSPTAAPESELAATLVPLVAHGRVIGDVCAAHPRGTPLSGTALEMLRFLAPTAALALDVLLLDEAGQRQREEERRMAEQLRQAEKMAALGELVAGVAHEINNPLTGISAFAELLLEESLGPEQRESARLIKREADRAVSVVRDLLTFSRKTEPAHLPLRLDELVERTVRMRAYALRTAGIALELDVAPGLPTVRGDEGKLQQVLLNLLLNAEYAMRESPVRRLVVRARPATAADLPADRAAEPAGGEDAVADSASAWVVIEVTDTGPGIGAEALARLFEPFYTTKPPGEGTGLGLSVSYGIVQAHGGVITAHSAPGGPTPGATFRVRLPLEPPAVVPGLLLPAPALASDPSPA